jgi:long-chain acyl-CoA synthetase
MAGIIAGNESLTFFAPTALLNRMAGDKAVLSAPLGNIRTILTGAGPVYAEDIKRALTTFGPRLWNGYGQGETPCTITAMGKDMLHDAWQSGNERRMTSVGIARSGITLKIVRADGSETSTDETGEVLVRGDTVMTGYLNQPDATAEALRDGWLRTGDLGCLDAEGYLHLSDRKKDVIISGGMNVYAREVEEVLLAHPGVAEVAVIGARDPKWGESVLAVIVLERGRQAPGDAALDALCLERLARFKRPKRYLYIDALPKNSAGKVLKARLRETYQSIFN